MQSRGIRHHRGWLAGGEKAAEGKWLSQSLPPFNPPSLSLFLPLSYFSLSLCHLIHYADIHSICFLSEPPCSPALLECTHWWMHTFTNAHTLKYTARWWWCHKYSKRHSLAAEQGQPRPRMTVPWALHRALVRNAHSSLGWAPEAPQTHMCTHKHIQTLIHLLFNCYSVRSAVEHGMLFDKIQSASLISYLFIACVGVSPGFWVVFCNVYLQERTWQVCF